MLLDGLNDFTTTSCGHDLNRILANTALLPYRHWCCCGILRGFSPGTRVCLDIGKKCAICFFVCAFY
jgi:hypothetical protein